MAYNKETLYEEQKRRQERFPPDRICFLRSATAAQEDRATMNAFRRGSISMVTACQQIAFHNKLDYVTKDQFLKAFEELGFAYYEDDFEL